MFDEKYYSSLKSNRLFRDFILYCVIGASCFAVAGILLIAFGIVSSAITGRIFCIAIGCLCLDIPLGFIIRAFGKPYLFNCGKIAGISGDSATISVTEFRSKPPHLSIFLKISLFLIITSATMC